MLGIKILSKKRYLSLLAQIAKLENRDSTRQAQVERLIRENQELRGALNEQYREYNKVWDELCDLHNGRVALNAVKKLKEEKK